MIFYGLLVAMFATAFLAGYAAAHAQWHRFMAHGWDHLARVCLTGREPSVGDVAKAFGPDGAPGGAMRGRK